MMKHLGSTLRFVTALLVACVIPAHAATWEDATGPHATTIVADAGPGGRYFIHRPATLGSNAHPVAVLCVGTGSNPRNYDAFLASLASHGVVAIADKDPYQGDGSRANEALGWLLEQNAKSGSEFFQKLVPSRVLGIGHSGGGNAAMLAAIRNPRITALLLYAPALEVGKSSELSIPTLFISGSRDATVTPEFVKARYREATAASAWYGEHKDQGHVGFASNPSIQHFTRAWVYTHLFGDSGTARSCFYGPGWTFRNAPGWNETLRSREAS